MDKEITKKFIENNGFICTQCGSVIVDGYNHENEEDLCEQCKIKKIKDLEYQLAKAGKMLNGYNAIRAQNKCMLARLEQINQDLKKQIDDIKKENKALEKILQNDNEIADLSKKVAFLEKQKEGLEQDFADAKCIIDELKAENETLKKALQGEIFINYKIPMENARLKQELAEFEDFMEEQGFEDLEHLKMQLDQYENCMVLDHDTGKWLKISDIMAENQALKARWEKLKEWVEEFHKDVVAVYPKTLLDKMKELEE